MGKTRTKMRSERGRGHLLTALCRLLSFLEKTGATVWNGGRDQTAPGRRRSLSQCLRPTRCQGGVGGVDPVGLAALRPTLRTAFAGGQYGPKRGESCNGDPVGLATLRPTLQSLLWPSGRRCYQREKFPARGPSHGKVARLLALGIVSD
jgi:hypothetical protein